MRLRQDRRCAHALAVLARPPHRCLCRPHQALSRLTSPGMFCFRAMDSTSGTPRALGYRLPAEWEPHAATWLTWPHKEATWPGKFEPIPDVWTALVQTLAEFEPVCICAGGETVMAEARRRVGNLPNVRLYDIETDDVWARDHGPMFLGGDGSLPPALV